MVFKTAQPHQGMWACPILAQQEKTYITVNTGVSSTTQRGVACSATLCERNERHHALGGPVEGEKECIS